MIRRVLLHQRNLPGVFSAALASPTSNGPINFMTAPSLTLQPSRFAGHNKWSNIRHGKAKVDALRSRNVGKACTMLQKVLRRSKGEFDPQFNSELAKALAYCSSVQVRKETIQRQFDRAMNAKLKQEFVIVKGPTAMAFLVEFLTESKSRAIGEMAKVLRKSKIVGLRVLEDMEMESFFKPQSVVLVAEDPSKVTSDEIEESDADDDASSKTVPPPLTLDLAEEIAIEYGAEEVSKVTSAEGHDGYEFVCEPFVMTKLVQVLQKMGHAVLNSETDYLGLIKHPPVDNDRDLDALVTKFYEALDDLDEFEQVYSNIEDSEDDEIATVA